MTSYMNITNNLQKGSFMENVRHMCRPKMLFAIFFDLLPLVVNRA